MNETVKDIIFFFGCIIVMAFCGCVTENKAVDVGGKGVYADSRSGKIAVGSLSVSTIPANTESVVFKVDEDTAWLSDRFLRDIDIRFTGTNAVSCVTSVVAAVCRTFSVTTNTVEVAE